MGGFLSRLVIILGRPDWQAIDEELLNFESK